MARGGPGKRPAGWQTSAAYKAVVRALVEGRATSGLTQRQLAERLKKPASWVAKIEMAERRVDLVEFVALIRAMGLDEAEQFKIVTSRFARHPDI